MSTKEIIPHSKWQHAYRLWKEALAQETFPQFDRWLSHTFSQNKSFGSKDRKWYTEILFAAIRHAYFALFCCLYENENKNNSHSLDLHRSVQNSLTLFRKFGQNYQNKTNSIDLFFHELRKVQIEDFFHWIVFCKEYFHTPEFSSLLDKETSLIEKMFFYSIPHWYASSLQERIETSHWSDQDGLHFLSAQMTRPPLWLRLNHHDKESNVILDLKNMGFTLHNKTPEIMDSSQNNLSSALAVQGSSGIYTLPSYQKGFFEIQDLASQRIGRHIDARPGQFVWDACAGGGGKTMQIASKLHNKGGVYASDIRAYKLEEIKKRAKRAGFFNIRLLPWEGSQVPLFPKEIQLRGGFDWVLVDAPCSSSGTWRRNPDAKYRFSPDHAEDLYELQFKLLNNSAQAVKKGGHLVYATCSWSTRENENIVLRFLQEKGSSFKCLSQSILGSPQEDSDTMFVAEFLKTNQEEIPS
jgi:16S rRNA (cytosine967-C5)-methyltransferase